MGTPVSKLTISNPHQYLTGMELLRRVKCMITNDPNADYDEEAHFHIGAQWEGEFDVGGTFRWSRQPDISKPKFNLLGQIVSYDYKYVLQYQKKGRETWKHEATQALVMTFKLRNSQTTEIAHWNKDLQQWILSKWMED